MKTSMLVHGFNATVIADVDGKYLISVSEHAGDTVDRMQSVFDYRFPRTGRRNVELLTPNGRVCFFDGGKYFAFGMYPVGGEEVAMVSVKCSHKMEREDALRYLDKGFVKATAKYQSFIKSKDEKNNVKR